MSGGTKLALAILIMWIAMVAFFFAFHPSGVVDSTGANIQNPLGILKWLADQFSGEVSPNPVQADASTLQTDLNKGVSIPGVTVGIPPGVQSA
jgi:hypothetical protein